MRSIPTVKLLILFAVAFSLASLSGPLSSNLHFPSIQLARAVPAPCPTHSSTGSCSEFWIPAGPQMDTLLGTIFTDEPTELTNIQSSSPSIDIADPVLTPDVIPNFQTNTGLFITDAIQEHSYFELQFHNDNNFWGVDFNFANDPTHAFCIANNASSTCAGVNIRQGIAHLIDRNLFATTDSHIVGGTAIDSPIQKSNGGLPSVDPCAWDILTHGNQPDVAPNCVVGGPGGVAYHVAPVSGAVFNWQANVHDPDFCIAADHFVLAGLATGHGTASSTTGCVLTGISAGATANPVNVFIRNDNPPRLDLGTGLGESLCALFTGVFSSGTNPCPEVTTHPGPITSFTGFLTSTSTVKKDWWIYTGAYIFTFPFDAGFYFTYTSHFVSGIPSIISPSGPCASDAVPTSSAPDYHYICNPGYDSLAAQMEFAPCLSDPSNVCPGTTAPTAIAAGEQVETYFGQEAFTIPVFSQTDHFGYLSNWQGVPNDEGAGLARGGFEWLNAYSPNPTIPGTIRQGFKASTTDINPYLSSTVLDAYVTGSIYDSIGAINTLANSQEWDFMTVSSSQTPLTCAQLTYACPTGTTATYRFTLRPDLFFQDGSPVTSFDLAFSYLSGKASGSFAGAAAGPMTGFTVLSKTQFDINLAGFGPFTKTTLTSLFVLPGHFWSNAGGSAWDSARATCTGAGSAACYPVQYTLGAKIFPSPCGGTGQPACMPIVVASLAGASSFPAANMNPNPNQLAATYDPLASGTLIGSGAWECNGGTLGTGCAPGNKMNPAVGQSYAFQRFGKGFVPNSPPFDVYFRSNGNLAVWIWTQNTGKFASDFVNFTTMAACFNLPVTTSAPCAHFQNGIGSANGIAGPAASVGINQVLAVNRFVGVNWVFPFDWRSSTAAPTGIAPIPQLGNNPATGGVAFHEGSVNLADCAFDPVHGYDC